ncbi:MAG: zinc metallopeptidase [Ruminiclostridium sp.]
MDIFYNLYYGIRTIFINPAVGIFFIAAMIFAVVSSIRVHTVFGKYNLVRTGNGVKAHEVARAILDINGLYDVQIVHVSGNLTDHYNPKTKTLALSDTVFGNATVGAIGVAAHECGHAVQHAKGYTPMKIRQAIYPVVSFCSRIWVIVFIIGCVAELFTLVQVAILLFSLVAVFQFITLPVEFDASKRAIDTLADNHILYGTELAGARKTLSAAAMTYVSGFLVTLAQLFRLLAQTDRRR